MQALSCREARSPVPIWCLKIYTTWRLSEQRPGFPRRNKEYRVGPKQVRNGSWRSLLGSDEALQSPEQPVYVDPSACGGTLTRREHASVEFTSPSGSRVVVDPIFRSPLLRCTATMPVPTPGIDAAFVTHSHGDHFNLATLDWLASRTAMIYVPPVPTRSLLAKDMLRQLDACGLPGEICETGSTTQVGGITVEALPFFGEQPSARVSPAEPGIRNWGNCYRVTTPGFSALVLADSGTDPSGSMITAISESAKRIDPVDIVIGSLRYLYLPFDVEGLACYYTVWPISEALCRLRVVQVRRNAVRDVGHFRYCGGVCRGQSQDIPAVCAWPDRIR
jgi:L-ascorbate metabolism protein UlaG (beta-lactamase superfamily)